MYTRKNGNECMYDLYAAIMQSDLGGTVGGGKVAYILMSRRLATFVEVTLDVQGELVVVVLAACVGV